MRQRRQKGGGGLMYFCIAFPNGLILLRELIGNQKASDYNDLFNSFIVPSIRLNIGSASNLVQDNCRIHTAKWLQKSYEASKVNVLDWPSRSPDLNIVENIWKMISDLVYDGVQPKDLNDLRAKINRAANVVNNEKRHVISNLYNTFRDRLVKVLLKKGNIIN